MPALGFPLAAPLDAEGFVDADAPNNITKLLTALSLPVQSFWDACEAFKLQLDLDDAAGVWLDLRGKLVGEPRNGLTDDVYRRRIRARIAVHRSTCTTEDLLRIVDLIVFDNGARYVLQTPSGGTVLIRVDGVAVSNEIAIVAQNFLQRAAGTGIRVIFQFDGVNDEAINSTMQAGFKVSALYDTSHGEGVTPNEWPNEEMPFPTGWAGGIGPDNVWNVVVETMKRKESRRPKWLDMETKLRDNGDHFDIVKCLEVLQIVQPIMGKKSL